MKLVKKVIYTKLEAKNTYYHGTIRKAIEVDKGEKGQFIYLSIEMKDIIFNASCRAEIDSNHVLYKVAMKLQEAINDKDLKTEDFVGCQVKFMVSDSKYSPDYSRLDVVEIDDETPEA